MIHKITLLLLFITIAFWSCPSGSKKINNVIFLSLDTTRYDYIDTGKGARARTPALKKFSEKSLVFEKAFTVCTQTLPSHLSVLTSRFPHELGVFGNDDRYDGRHKMIQQLFDELGYNTIAVTSLGTLGSETGISPGFRQFREKLCENKVFFADAAKVTAEATAAIRALEKSDRFFLFVHYSDPHTPYAPPGITANFTITLDGKPVSRFNALQGAILKEKIPLARGDHVMEFSADADMKDISHFVIRGLKISNGSPPAGENLEYSETLYGGAHRMKKTRSRIEFHSDADGYVQIFQVIPMLKTQAALKYYRLEVEYMDLFVGEFLESIEKLGLNEDTIIVIFADHGEGHGERDGFFGHTRFLNRQFIHVPLIVRIPGYEAGRIETPVSLAGISPAILEYLGYRDRSFDNGKSILKPLKKTACGENPVYSFGFDRSTGTHKVSVIQWPFQGIFNLKKGQLQSSEYYNLETSPSYCARDAITNETMADASPDYMEIFLREIRNISGILRFPIRNRDLDEKDREKLRALGYIQDPT